jgi:hypothetical protein
MQNAIKLQNISNLITSPSSYQCRKITVNMKISGDVALITYNPLDIQTMVDIAVDFSKREGYQLQPAKSVILPVKSKIKTIETNKI